MRQNAPKGDALYMFIYLVRCTHGGHAYYTRTMLSIVGERERFHYAMERE